MMRRWPWLLAVLAIMALVGVGYRAILWQAGPPIVRIPLEQVEPPRTVAAEEWQSPYCGFWDDGCTECTRESSASKATCRISSEARTGECKRRLLMCFRPMTGDELERYCQAYVYYLVRISPLNNIYGVNHQVDNIWKLSYFIWKTKEGRLPGRAGDSLTVISRNKWKVYTEYHGEYYPDIPDEGRNFDSFKQIKDIKKLDIVCIRSYITNRPYIENFPDTNIK